MAYGSDLWVGLNYISPVSYLWQWAGLDSVSDKTEPWMPGPPGDTVSGMPWCLGFASCGSSSWGACVLPQSELHLSVLGWMQPQWSSLTASLQVNHSNREQSHNKQCFMVSSALRVFWRISHKNWTGPVPHSLLDKMSSHMVIANICAIKHNRKRSTEPFLGHLQFGQREVW